MHEQLERRQAALDRGERRIGWKIGRDFPEVEAVIGGDPIVGHLRGHDRVRVGKKTTRDEAAKLLRQIADGLTGDGKVELEQDGWELKLSVARQVELEIELTWSIGRGGGAKTGGGS